MKLFFFGMLLWLPLAQANKINFVTEIHRPEALQGLEVHLKRPVQEGKFPAVILFGGFETGARAIDLFDPPVPIQLLTFEYPFRPPRKLEFPGGLKYAGEARRAIPRTLEGIEALVDWAKTQPGLDPDRIVLVGASFGAPFVSLAAAQKPEVRGLILAHGFADVGSVIVHRLSASFERRYGTAGRWLAQVLGRLLWWLSGAPSVEDALGRLHQGQSVLLLTARDDDLLPPDSIAALRASVARSKAKVEERVLPGAHLRPGEDALVRQLLGESLEWMRREGILPGRGAMH